MTSSMTDSCQILRWKGGGAGEKRHLVQRPKVPSEQHAQNFWQGFWQANRTWLNERESNVFNMNQSLYCMACFCWFLFVICTLLVWAERRTLWIPSEAQGAGASYCNSVNVSTELISAGGGQVEADGQTSCCLVRASGEPYCLSWNALQVTSDPGGAKESAGMCRHSNGLHYTQWKSLRTGPHVLEGVQERINSAVHWTDSCRSEGAVQVHHGKSI